MKTKWIMGCTAAILLGSNCYAQDWTLAGNTITTSEWFGAGLGSTIPLSFETRVNQRMDWRTNNIWRMRLMGDNFLGNVNGFSPLDLSGFLGIGTFGVAPFFQVAQPFAFIHIDDQGTNSAGYRPWQRQGTLITHESDQGYFGLKNEGVDRNHTTVVWSDNDAFDPAGPDRLKFIFTANNAIGVGIAGNYDGLEAGRFTPAGTGNEAFFGLGDWFTATLDPTERLDLLNGRARVRQLPTDPLSVSTEFVTVNTTPGANFGVLEHRPITSLPDNCEWTMNAVSPNHVWTAFGAADPACPDENENVSIGDNGSAYPNTKLTVRELTPTTGTDIAIRAETEGTTGTNYGIYTTCNNFSTSFATQNWALRSEARNATSTTGLFAKGVVDLVGPGSVIVNGLNAVSTATAAVHSVYGQRTDATLAAPASSTAIGSYVGLIMSSGATVATSAYGSRNHCTAQAGSSIVQVLYGNFSSGRSSSSSTPTVHAVYGDARGTPLSSGALARVFGVSGVAAMNPGANTIAYGVAGAASGGSVANYSIYGYYQTGGSTGSDFSGYFEGDIKVNGVYYPSDDALKLNEQPIPDALALVDQMQPLQYEYDVANYPSLHLRSGTQLGLKAQDLELICPSLVRSAHQPAVIDTLGNVVTPGVDYKAIDYIGLVPVLISAVKVQQAQIADMQQQITSCCAFESDHRSAQGQGANTIGYIDNTLAPATTDVRALRPDELVVTPNPFTENPTISYRIGTSGRAQLRVSDANGRDMGLLFDTGMQAGQHSMMWNTAAMAAGTYWLVLTLDGKRITEQAVKVQ